MLVLINHHRGFVERRRTIELHPHTPNEAMRSRHAVDVKVDAPHWRQHRVAAVAVDGDDDQRARLAFAFAFAFAFPRGRPSLREQAASQPEEGGQSK